MGDAATTTKGAEHRGAPPSRHTFPGDKMGEDGGGREARIDAGGDHGGGEMGSGPGRAEGWGAGWVLAFLVSLFVFLLARRRPYYDWSGWSGLRKTDM